MPDTAAHTAPAASPDWRTRVITLSYYVGVAAIARPGGGGFRDHHRAQALAVFFLLLALAAAFAASVVAVSHLMTAHRAWYEAWTVEAHILNVFRKLFLCWLVFWAFGAGMALLGAVRDLPVLTAIARRSSLLLAARVGTLAFGAILACAALLGAHALSLVRHDDGPAPAFCLYHDDGTFPRMVFALGFYRVALAARARWGPDSVQLLPLTRASVGRAIGQGTFLFIGSHGIKSGLLLDEGSLRPEDVATMRKSPDLSFVYLAGCDSGAERAGWEQAFAPAEVVTFERLTSVLEHTWWLWFEGPRRIADLPAR